MVGGKYSLNSCAVSRSTSADASVHFYTIAMLGSLAKGHGSRGADLTPKVLDSEFLYDTYITSCIAIV